MDEEQRPTGTLALLLYVIFLRGFVAVAVAEGSMSSELHDKLMWITMTMVYLAVGLCLDYFRLCRGRDWESATRHRLHALAGLLLLSHAFGLTACYVCMYDPVVTHRAPWTTYLP